MYSLSSLDDIDILVGLLVDDLWEAEDDNTGFFSVGVDSYDLFFYGQFPCPWCKIVLKIEYIINEDKWESSTNRKMRKRILINDPNIILVRPPLWKDQKIKKC